MQSKVKCAPEITKEAIISFINLRPKNEKIKVTTEKAPFFFKEQIKHFEKVKDAFQARVSKIAYKVRPASNSSLIVNQGSKEVKFKEPAVDEGQKKMAKNEEDKDKNQEKSKTKEDVNDVEFGDLAKSFKKFEEAEEKDDT